jgi:glutamine amidotransferase
MDYTALIDYGMGNLRSVEKALEYVGLKVIRTSDADVVKGARAVVLPGVGAFRDAMENLHRLKLYGPILSHIEKGKPFLGICLGLQLLFERSYEFGEEKGFWCFGGRGSLAPTKGKNSTHRLEPTLEEKELIPVGGHQRGRFCLFCPFLPSGPKEGGGCPNHH